MACRVVADDDDGQTSFDAGRAFEFRGGCLDHADHRGSHLLPVDYCRHAASP